MREVGIIGVEEVINWGLSGDQCYELLEYNGIFVKSIYDEFDWGVQWQKGDSLSRYLVRIGEMIESIKIIQQALKQIPGGPYEKARNPELNDFDN